MAVSLILLTASQWFWLKSEYKEQRRAFYNNSNLLFKETVRSIEDSLVSKSISSVFFERKTKPIIQDRSGVIKKKRLEPIEVIIEKEFDPVEDSLKKKRILVKGFAISSDNVILERDTTGLQEIRLEAKEGLHLEDSLRKLTRVVSQIPRISILNSYFDAGESKYNQPNTGGNHRRFSFTSGSLDSVRAVFNKKIKAFGYPVEFIITKDSLETDTLKQNGRRNRRTFSEMHKRFYTAEDSLVYNGVKMLNPEVIYSYSILPFIMFEANPKNLDTFLYTKLRSNLLFSLFLLTVTAITFGVIYKHLQRQARLNKIKNDLISNISHELKTPLSTLSVALEALKQFGATANPKTQEEYLDISQNEVKRLSLMVDNILKTSLLEQQSININPANINLQNIVSELSKAWKPRFEQLKGVLNVINHGQDFNVYADEVQVASILNNLIDNAVKYSFDNPSVIIHLSEKTSFIEVSVKDTGIGIPKEYQNQVFEKFFRVPTGDRHNVKGYGLGLNFVKHIMDLHGGKVSLKSDEQGSEFKLSFKRQPNFI